MLKLHIPHPTYTYSTFTYHVRSTYLFFIYTYSEFWTYFTLTWYVLYLYLPYNILCELHLHILTLYIPPLYIHNLYFIHLNLSFLSIVLNCFVCFSCGYYFAASGTPGREWRGGTSSSMQEGADMGEGHHRSALATVQTREATAHEYFSMFIMKELMEHSVYQTNMYVRQKNLLSTFVIDEAELSIFIGIVNRHRESSRSLAWMTIELWRRGCHRLQITCPRTDSGR